MDYYLLVNNQQMGPYSPHQIQSMWNSGAITSDSFYWNVESEAWEPIKQLIETLNPPAPPPVIDAPIPPVVVAPPSLAVSSPAPPVVNSPAPHVSLPDRVPMHEEEEYEYDDDDDDGDGCGGWLAWIAILGIINFLSYIFDWPFWVY